MTFTLQLHLGQNKSKTTGAVEMAERAQSEEKLGTFKYLLKI